MPASAAPAAEASAGPATGDGERLSNATLSLYALPGATVSFAYTLIIVAFLNFATDVLHASAAAVGLVLAGSKVWDAVSDPVAGFLSDRTRSRLGRRKPWLLVSSIPLAAFSVMLWMPPPELEDGPLIAWIAVAIFGFYTAYTAFEVPHLSLGAELSFDPQQRNRIYGFRQLFKMIGLVAAGSIGVGLVESADARANVAVLVVAAAALMALSLWSSVRALPRERTDPEARGAANPLRAVRDVWGNRLARIVLTVYFIESLGIGGIGTLTLYVIKYVLEMPGTAWMFLMVWTGAAIAGIPLWIRLGRRFEKRRLWMVAMAMSGVGFGMISLVEPGAWGIMLASSLLAGTAGACGSTIGTSLKADLIDVDELRTGERKEGAYFAAWSFVSKLASGLMMATVGLVLGAVGYQENQVQPQLVRDAMLFLMGGMPLIGFGIGMLLFRRFDLTEAEHTRIRAELDARALARAREAASRA